MIWLFSRSDYRLQKRKTLFWVFGQLYGQIYAHDEEEIGKIFLFLEYLIEWFDYSPDLAARGRLYFKYLGNSIARKVII